MIGTFSREAHQALCPYLYCLIADQKTNSRKSAPSKLGRRREHGPVQEPTWSVALFMKSFLRDVRNKNGARNNGLKEVKKITIRQTVPSRLTKSCGSHLLAVLHEEEDVF